MKVKRIDKFNSFIKSREIGIMTRILNNLVIWMMIVSTVFDFAITYAIAVYDPHSFYAFEANYVFKEAVKEGRPLNNAAIWGNLPFVFATLMSALQLSFYRKLPNTKKFRYLSITAVIIWLIGMTSGVWFISMHFQGGLSWW